MSSPATAPADPGTEGRRRGGSIAREDARAFSPRTSAAAARRKMLGGTAARDVHAGGGLARQQQRRDSNGSTEGGRVGSGHVGSRRSASSSKTSARHRSGRKVSSEATGTGRLLFGDDDGDRSGGERGGAEDGGGRRGGEPGAVNRRHSRPATKIRAPSTGDTRPVTKPRGRTSAGRRGGAAGRVRTSRRSGGAPSFDRPGRSPARESTRERRATRETAVNTDRSEAEEGGGRDCGKAWDSPSRKSAGREVPGRRVRRSCRRCASSR